MRPRLRQVAYSRQLAARCRSVFAAQLRPRCTRGSALINQSLAAIDSVVAGPQRHALGAPCLPQPNEGQRNTACGVVHRGRDAAPPVRCRLLPRRALCAGIQTVRPPRKRHSAQPDYEAPHGLTFLRPRGAASVKGGESANWLVASLGQVRPRGHGESTAQRRG